MKLITLSTGSKGNCYILKSTNGKFCILDCGMHLKDITSNGEFSSFTNLDFVFCSHEHKDHSLSMKDFENSGCEIISYNNANIEKAFEIGQWKIKLFHVKHNCLNYGAIIHDTIEKKTLCYVTDFTEIPKIKNINHWLYEINYDEFTVDKLIDTQDISKLHVANNIKYHNSLENAETYFKNLENKPKLIVACHMSLIGGLKENIMRKMKKHCDKIVVAKKNLVVEF